MTEVTAAQGDITRFPAEVIVNAANESLLGGGGVDGAIHRAAGPELLAATRALGGACTGEAKITDAYGIRTAQRIVHTVGPVYGRQSAERSAELLAACYRNSLDLATGYRSIAVPANSTGVYGNPMAEATDVAVRTIRDWVAQHPESALETITLIAFNAPDLAILQRALDATP
jgi:O-acetyl-ADP-ribose deacetylase (regulator of RNase III)